MKKNYFIIGLILISLMAIFTVAQENATCGDSICNLAETCSSCATDCGCASGDTCTENACVILVEVPPAEPSIACDATQCDDECITCSDNACHSPDFVCIEKFEIDKITPKTTGIGINQLNILIKNTGNVDLYSISAEASGDGIISIERIDIDKLAAGDKDYAFIKINATKAGMIDLVIKLYMKGELVDKEIGQLNVTEEKVVASQQEDFSPAQIATSLTALKKIYENVEAEYLAKKESNYNVDLIYDSLKGTNNDIKNTQIYLSEKNYKKASINIGLINGSLNEISSDLNNAKKKRVALADRIRNNMIYIGSIAAAVISLFTAFTLIRNKSKEHIDKLKTIKIPKMHLKKKPEEKKKEKKDNKAKKKKKK